MLLGELDVFSVGVVALGNNGKLGILRFGLLLGGRLRPLGGSVLQHVACLDASRSSSGSSLRFVPILLGKPRLDDLDLVVLLGVDDSLFSR